MKRQFSKRNYKLVPLDQSILEWFRNRELSNYYDLKQLPESEINKLLDELNPKYNFTYKPFLHQKVMFYIGAKKDNWCMLADMGTGKSASALSLIDYRYNKEVDKPSLIVAPSVSHVGEWQSECNKFAPHLKIISLIGPKEERLKLVEQPGDIYLINYDGLQVILNKPKGNSRKISIHPDDVKAFGSRFKTIIYDELVHTGSIQSITWKVCKLLSQQIPYRYGLTGRPIGRDLLKLWPQLYVLDMGETLGTSLNIFRQSFFIPKQTYFSIEWKPDPDQRLNLRRILKNRTIRYSAKECLDLPPVVPVPISLELPEDTKKYYRKVKENLISQIKLSKSNNWITKVNNNFIKFRQVCSGYLVLKDEELDEDTGAKKITSSELITFTNPKESALEEIVESLPEGKKLIIFYSYTLSGKRIIDKLKQMNIGYAWLYGSTKDKIGTINKFKLDPDCRVFVVNSLSGSEGLNLQVANYILFYENPLTARDRAQAEKRAHRTGQTETVFIYDLLCKNTIEERIMNFIKEGEKEFQLMIEGKSEAQAEAIAERYTKNFIDFSSIDKAINSLVGEG